ncbi:unnamed protein product [Cladocopium goreaui]|uniref:Dicer-like protein 2 n=1 Tax=Cladocopium goreaui TaxID=2562237 RepID=A0A9P1C648_9DINO|nr:unnamed protein product [Cladocopium goreaui]
MHRNRFSGHSCCTTDIARKADSDFPWERRFLRPHPLSQSVTLLRALKLLPLLLQKLKRLDAMAELGALLADLLEYKRHPESKRSEFTFLQPFQTRTYDGRRHALEEERRLLQRLSEFQVDHADQDQETASHLLSKVEMEWILEVATTGTGAEEPYDFTRLAWLGDAVVFFIAVTLECKEEGPLELRQRRAAALISNRCLAKVASSFGLERFLNTVPIAAKKEPPPMGQKVPADALEALLGALLLVGGLQSCFVFMSRLHWFHTEDGGDYCVPFQSPSDASTWLGAALVRLSCTAWLLSSHPELSAEGLSDLRAELLTAGPESRIASFPAGAEQNLQSLERWAGQRSNDGVPVGGTFEMLSEYWAELQSCRAAPEKMDENGAETL